MQVMVTGSEGFIGSNLTQWIAKWLPSYDVVRVDAMTYASREQFPEAEQYPLERVDIRDQAAVGRLMKKYKPDAVMHLAAESHVCRSITGPRDFMTTNIMGTFNLLEELRAVNPQAKFIHVSTDEVFGELCDHEAPFCENTSIKPRSPYAASKASSDLIALAYHHTYGAHVIVTNCSNNFGPNQHEEKLIPRTVQKIMLGEPVTIYGDGTQVRDWLHVEAHCHALMSLTQFGVPGERYCIGGETELPNRILIEQIFQAVEDIVGKEMPRLISFTNDRPTDDRRYAINCDKIKALGWQSDADNFEVNLMETVRYYVDAIHKTKAANTRGVSHQVSQ